MSNTVAHLAVASRVLEQWPALAGNEELFTWEALRRIP